MYYLIRYINSYDCYVTRYETLKELAKDLSEYNDDGESIIVSDLSKKEKRELRRLQERLEQ